MTPFVDVVFQGVRRRLPVSALDVGDLSTASEVRAAAERAFGLPASALAGHAVLRLGRAIWLRVPLAVRLRAAARRLRAGIGRVLSHGAQAVMPVLRVLWAPVRFALSIALHVLEAAERLGSLIGRVVGEFIVRGLGVARRVGRVLHRIVEAIGWMAFVLIVPLIWTVALIVAALARVRGAFASAGRCVRSAVAAAVRRPAARVGRCVRIALRAVGRGSETVLDGVSSMLSRLARPVLRAVSTVLAHLGRLVVRTVSSVLAHLARPVGSVLRAASKRLRPVGRAWRAALALLRAWLFGVVDRAVTGRDRATRELDHRRALFDALLSSPHRRLGPLHAAHVDLCRRDPIFYMRLAAWYAVKGEGRDHLEMFVIVLVTSALAEHREVGLALLRALPPYQVGRVVDFIRGKISRRGTTAVREGLFRNPSRALRTEVERYLREREASADAFDGAVLSARATLKRLYTTLHIRPSARAQAILFDRDPPDDSRVAAVRRAAQATDPGERARIVREARLPFRVAASLVPAAEVVEHMSSAEVINHMALLQRSGALDDEARRRHVERRLQEAVTARRVSTLRAARAAETVDETWAERLRQLTAERVRAHGRLRQPTALLVDASASMDVALDVGRRIAAMLAVASDAPLHVLAFRDRAWPVVPARADMSGWIQAFDGIAAEGATSPGAAVLALLRAGHAVDQIVLITDQRENASPRFVPAVRLYRRRLGVRDLRVVFVNVGDAVDTLALECRRLRMEVASWNFQGDDYAIPDLLPLLVQPTRTRLVIDIMATPLPTRRRA